MKKKVYTFIAALLSVSLVSCSPEKSTAESGDTVSTEGTSTAENLTENKNDSTSESAAESIAEQQKYSFETFTFPTQIADVKPVKAKAFKYSELIAGQKGADIGLFAMNDDYICISKYTGENTDVVDITYYKYNIQNDTLTELDGIVPDYNVSLGMSAFVGEKLYSVCESFNERMHYVVDMEENTVDILTKKPVNQSAISFYFTYPVSNTEYAERWFDFDEEDPDKNIEHIVLYDEDGNSREIFTKDCDNNKVMRNYSVWDNKIYEYAHNIDSSQAYLNTYDFDGNPLSEIYLKEVSEVLGRSENNAAEKFNVFGDFFAVQVYDETDYIKKLFIQNEKDGTLLVLNDCWYIPTMSSATPENYIFGHNVTVPNDPNEPTVVDLYSMNSSGEIIKIAEGLDFFSYIVSNGKAVAYIDNDELYIIKL